MKCKDSEVRVCLAYRWSEVNKVRSDRRNDQSQESAYRYCEAFAFYSELGSCWGFEQRVC